MPTNQPSHIRDSTICVSNNLPFHSNIHERECSNLDVRCDVYYLFYNFSMYLLTIDRLIAILFPLRHRVLITRKLILRFIVGMCIIAITLGISIVLNHTLFAFFEKYMWLSLNAAYMIVCCITYGLIFFKIRSRRRFETSLEPANVVSRRQRFAVSRNIKFFKIAALIISSFIILVLIPDMILHFYPVHGEIVFDSLYTVWTIGLILDPVTYIFLQDDLRFLLKNKFCKLRRQEEATQQETAF